MIADSEALQKRLIFVLAPRSGSTLLMRTSMPLQRSPLAVNLIHPRRAPRILGTVDSAPYDHCKRKCDGEGSFFPWGEIIL